MTAFVSTTMHRLRVMGYDTVRIAVGGLLLVAAGLKGYQLWSEPLITTGLLTSRWFLITVVEVEVLLGMCSLAAFVPFLTWFATLSCFTSFAAVSLAKAVLGEVSCGCFGRVQIHPWFVFAFDANAVAALLLFPPHRIRWHLIVRGIDVNSFPGIVVLVGWLAIGAPGALAMGALGVAKNDVGDVYARGKVRAFNRRSLGRKAFPLVSAH